ncbi:nitrogen regulation protein NR(II) [candidate division CSSED10-310 bacterium]|uniref:histidine kinase n=1 Tax=candidate division CSSED10-310 bacterium TaxID=2855610 RepID=A0ABV6YV04_UNCC1
MNSQSFLQNLVSSSADAITFVDHNGVLKLFNTAAEVLTGYKKEDVLDRPIVNFYPDEEEFRKILNLVEKEGACKGIETNIKNRDGSIIPISMSISLVYDEKGSFIGTLGISRDLRPIKRLQKHITHLERAAVLSLLAAETAHEINNPLEIIKNYLFILNSEINEKRQSHFLFIISKEIERINTIVKNLTKLAYHKEFPKIELDLSNFLQEFHDFISTWAMSHKVELSVIIQPDLVPITSSPDHLKQVLLNFTLNAFEAMPQGGKLTIEINQTDHETKFIFHDTGPGHKDVQSLFLPPKVHSEAHKGLGLSISFGIISAMGGHIETSPKPGQGTKFVIHLPRDVSDEE